MMKLFEAARFLNTSLPVRDELFTSVSIDTRTLKSGGLFIALEGERFNGHAFIAEAYRKGAVGAVVSQAVQSSMPLITVSNTVEALGLLAHQYRLTMPASVIAVTGSCGKTTTRALAVNIFSQVAATLSSMRSFNNAVGVPLTLLNLAAFHEYAVIEMGASHLGEIDTVTRLAAPVDAAIITAIEPAHLEGFGSINNIAKAKFEIANGLHKDGTLVLPYEKFHQYWSNYNKHSVVTFDLETESADVYAKNIRFNKTGCAGFELCMPIGRCVVQLKLAGRHNVGNALAAASAAMIKKIPLQMIQKGLEQAMPVARRLNILRGIGDAVIIDDAYNANPAAMKAAIEVLARYDKQRILVIGDMLELGKQSVHYHQIIGDYAKKNGIHQLFTFGEYSESAALQFGKNGHHYTTHEALIQALIPYLNRRAVVLIKGSLGMKMEKVVQALLKKGLK
jgi:UDP-N-acetylmuramoyl-tripeptide--D-alanyl-D-alanine ligase